MSALKYVPLVFVVGIDGFVMFAPYVILVLSLTYLARSVRPEPQPVRVKL